MPHPEATEARRRLMLEKPVQSGILRMAAPTMIAFLITSVYNLTDTYFVSSLGTAATAAVSVNGSLDSIIMAAGSVMALGAGSYISRLLGANDRSKAAQVLACAFYIALCFGAAVGLLGSLFTKPLVRLLGATDSCELYARQYASFVLTAAPFTACNFVMNSALKSEGSATFAMFGTAVGGIVNSLLDPVFIFYAGLGVQGASLATAISKVVSFLVLLSPYLRGKSALYISIRCFRPTAEIMRQIFSIGVGSLLRNGLSVLASIVLNRMAGGISDSLLAGIGVTTRIMQFPFGFALGFSNGLQAVAGFNWGARRFDRVWDSYRWASIIGLGGSLLVALPLILLPGTFIALFARTDPDMLYYGALCIRVQAITLPLLTWGTVVNHLCGALGLAVPATLLAASRQGLCLFPILPPLVLLFGAYGVVCAQGVADGLTALLSIPIHFYILRRIRRAQDCPPEDFVV